MSATSADRPAPGSPGELFIVFSTLALQGFGGVRPVASYTLVERHRWISVDEFTDILARCHEDRVHRAHRHSARLPGSNQG